MVLFSKINKFQIWAKATAAWSDMLGMFFFFLNWCLITLNPHPSPCQGPSLLEALWLAELQWSDTAASLPPLWRHSKNSTWGLPFCLSGRIWPPWVIAPQRGDWCRQWACSDTPLSFHWHSKETSNVYSGLSISGDREHVHTYIYAKDTGLFGGEGGK